jgi:hypothetical protein
MTAAGRMSFEDVFQMYVVSGKCLFITTNKKVLTEMKTDNVIDIYVENLNQPIELTEEKPK